MKAIKYGYNIVCALILLGTLLMLTGCELGNTVMLSKGQAGGFQQVLSGTAEYCKWTSTDPVPMSQAAQEAFVKYCADVE